MSPVRTQIEQRRPFAGPEDEAAVSLLRRADRLRVRLTGVVESWGITLQQYNVLRILRGAGEEGLPTLEIAARMIEHSPGITRLLERLEAKGLVARRHCPRDRRRVLCHATGRALRVLAALDAPVSQAAACALDGRGQVDFVRLLDAIDPSRPPPRGAGT